MSGFIAMDKRRWQAWRWLVIPCFTIMLTQGFLAWIESTVCMPRSIFFNAFAQCYFCRRVFSFWRSTSFCKMLTDWCSLLLISFDDSFHHLVILRPPDVQYNGKEVGALEGKRRKLSESPATHRSTWVNSKGARPLVNTTQAERATQQAHEVKLPVSFWGGVWPCPGKPIHKWKA